MIKQFKETNIPESVSLALAKEAMVIEPPHVDKFATVAVHAISRALGAVKNPITPKAISVKSMTGDFIFGAKVEYNSNEDNPQDISAGRWDYSWTAYEEDLERCDIINLNDSSLLQNYLLSSSFELFGIKFNNGASSAVTTIVTVLEHIKKWLGDNVTPDEDAVLELEGSFKATASVSDDGEIEYGFVPAGEMKVLIKNDSAIQE